MVNVKRSFSCFANDFMMPITCRSLTQRLFRACQGDVWLKFLEALALDLIRKAPNTLKTPVAFGTSLHEVQKILDIFHEN